MTDTLAPSSDSTVSAVDTQIGTLPVDTSQSEENSSSESIDVTPKATTKTPKAEYAQFAALKRAERELRQQQTQYKSEIEKLQSSALKYQELEQLREKDPMAVLEKLGLSYDKLSEKLLQDKRPPAEKKLSSVEERLIQLEERLKQEEEKKQSLAQEQAEREREEFIQHHKNNFKNYIDEKKDTYELMSLHSDAPGLVFETILEYHQQHGKELTLEQACDMIENHLFEDAKRYTNLNKIKSLLQPPTQAVKEDKKESPAQKKQIEHKPITTLSNNVVTEMTQSRSADLLSEEERMAQAIALLKRR